jgi:hypothetical protein
MIEALKIFLTDREPGCGYFGGAQGALRFLVFGLIACLAVFFLH